MPSPLSPEQLAMFEQIPADDLKAATRSARKALARNARKANKDKHSGSVGFTPEPLVARNENQHIYLEAIDEENQVFVVGPAGVGKTYIAARKLMKKLLARELDFIAMARPSVGKAKHRLGFRPGKQDDKMEDWMVPIMKGFRAEASAHTIASLKQQGRLEFLAFETLRGRDLERCGIILDEAQNCDWTDLKLFLTRQGEGSKLIVCGDIEQVDIEDSGFEAVLNMIDDEHNDIDAVILMGNVT